MATETTQGLAGAGMTDYSKFCEIWMSDDRANCARQPCPTKTPFLLLLVQDDWSERKLPLCPDCIADFLLHVGLAGDVAVTRDEQ
jgi:hypothetical protein